MGNEIFMTDTNEVTDTVVDIVIIGAGLGGLCAGAILNTLYNKKVAIFESHYLPGGCAHAFDRTTTTTRRNFKRILILIILIPKRLHLHLILDQQYCWDVPKNHTMPYDKY